MITKNHNLLLHNIKYPQSYTLSYKQFNTMKLYCSFIPNTLNATSSLIVHITSIIFFNKIQSSDASIELDKQNFVNCHNTFSDCMQSQDILIHLHNCTTP